jgi:DNA topoisomerase I
VFSGKSKQWFASCSRWPDCEGTLPLNDDGTVGEPEPEPEPDPNVVCPEDGGLMIPRTGKFGLFYGCENYPKCKGILNVQNRAVYKDPDTGEVKPFRSPTDPAQLHGAAHVAVRQAVPRLHRLPDDQFAIWSVPLAFPCPECGAPLRPPPKNRKVPTVVCTHPELEHVFEADDFDLPEVVTMEVVPATPPTTPKPAAPPCPNRTSGRSRSTCVWSTPAPQAQARQEGREEVAKKTAKKSTAKKSAAKKAAAKKATD